MSISTWNTTFIRRILLLVLLILFACAHAHPPGPPLPIPPPAPEPRPPAKQKAHLLLGYYGIGSGSGLNFKADAKALYDSARLNGIKAHGNGAIWQTGIMPWGADMKLNPVYLAAFHELCSALEWYHLELAFNFFDQYESNQSKLHWPPGNTQPLNAYFGTDLRLLYNAYNYGTKKNTWFQCTDEKIISTCHVLPGYEFMEEYINAILSELSTHPELFVYLRVFNEQGCRVTPTGGCDANGLGGYVQIQQWVEQKAQILGMKRGVNYLFADDFWNHNADGTPYWGAVGHGGLVGSSNYQINILGGLKEVHRCDPFLVDQMAAHGIARPKIWCSDDSNPDGDMTGKKQIADYVWSGKVGYGDVKLSTPSTSWNVKNIQENFDKYLHDVEVAIQ